MHFRVPSTQAGCGHPKQSCQLSANYVGGWMCVNVYIMELYLLEIEKFVSAEAVVLEAGRGEYIQEF